MITLIVFAGLIGLTTILVLKKNIYLMAAVLIPMIYGSYYYATTEIPKRFGYAIALDFIDLPESRVLDAFERNDSIFLLLVIKGEKEPRLVSVANTESNREKVSEINKKLKSGMVVVKKNGSGGNKGTGTGDIPDDSQIKIVPMEEQTIIKKESSE